jgi:hypothetical protein
MVGEVTIIAGVGVVMLTVGGTLSKITVAVSAGSGNESFVPSLDKTEIVCDPFVSWEHGILADQGFNPVIGKTGLPSIVNFINCTAPGTTSAEVPPTVNGQTLVIGGIAFKVTVGGIVSARGVVKEPKLPEANPPPSEFTE